MTNRRPTTLYLVLALYVGLLASSARGAGVVGNGSPASCTDAALASALGGGLVTFNCGAGSVVIPINTYVIAAGDSVIVDGSNQITLDGEDSRQHFYVVDGASLQLQNLELANGRSFSGGAILNQGSLNLENTTFTSNDAESFGSGGAI